MRPCTESTKRRADDGRTIHTYIHIPYIARIAVPFMWGSLRLAPHKRYSNACNIWYMYNVYNIYINMYICIYVYVIVGV